MEQSERAVYLRVCEEYPNHCGTERERGRGVMRKKSERASFFYLHKCDDS